MMSEEEKNLNSRLLRRRTQKAVQTHQLKLKEKTTTQDLKLSKRWACSNQSLRIKRKAETEQTKIKSLGNIKSY